MARSSAPLLLLGAVGLAFLASSKKAAAAPAEPVEPLKGGGGGGGGGGGSAPPRCAYVLAYSPNQAGTTGTTLIHLKSSTDAGAHKEAAAIAASLAHPPSGAVGGQWDLIKTCGDTSSGLGAVKSFQKEVTQDVKCTYTLDKFGGGGSIALGTSEVGALALASTLHNSGSLAPGSWAVMSHCGGVTKAVPGGSFG